MQWTVEGADEATGTERSITVDAVNETEAAAVARARGLFVSRVSRAESAELHAVAYAARSSATARSTYREPVPAYTSIRGGSFVLNVVGLLYLLAGLLASVVAVYTFIAPSHGADSEVDHTEGAILLASGLGAIGAGLVLLMLGSIALAIRDIARNSFRR